MKVFLLYWKTKSCKNEVPRWLTTISNRVEDFCKHLYSSGNQEENQYQRRKIKNVGSEEVLQIDNGELLTALHKMKNRKSTGENQITSEMIKMRSEILLDNVRVLLNKSITEERIPNKWQNAIRKETGKI